MKVLILNSTGFSDIGWVTEPKTQETLADSLRRAGVGAEIAEVACAADVEQLLGSLDGETVVWPNAYYVRRFIGSDETRWLAEMIEEANVPFIGSSAATLRAVLHKDDCQARLSSAGIPVPRFVSVMKGETGSMPRSLEAAGLSWPLVVKPTTKADSIGIAVFNDAEGMVSHLEHIFEEYGPRAIIEEYLPSTDITVGIVLRGKDPILMTTWYEMTDRDGILDHPTRLIPWGGPKQMRLVKDPAILGQVETIVPRAARALGIRDFTRVDGRLDGRGVLRIFDVNGMPSLDYPHTVTLRQLMTVWDGMDALLALDRLVASVIASAAERYGFDVPRAVAERALGGAGESHTPVSLH